MANSHHTVNPRDLVRAPARPPPTPVEDDDVFTNPFHGIVEAAIKNKNTVAIKHKTLHDYYERYEIPDDWNKYASGYYRDGMTVEISEQLSVILPYIIAVEGPEPATDYNAIMTEAYRRWAERARLFKSEKLPDDDALRSGVYDIPPPPAGVDAQRYYSNDLMRFVTKHLLEDVEGYDAEATEADQRIAVGRYCLEEFQGWTDDWREELDGKEELYQEYDGSPPALSADVTFA